MADQEFLSGGFIGKVGNVVGQHWKNKRYIRAYVVPRDPKTPAQMATRALFKHAIELSQQAMNINGKASYWRSNTRTEWQSRLKTCLGRLNAGLPDSQAIPLYPDGFVFSTLISGVEANYDSGDALLYITSSEPVMTESRDFRILVNSFDRETGKFREEVFRGTAEKGETFGTMLDWDRSRSYPDGAWIEAATSDDATHGDKAITLPRTDLLQPETPWLEVDISLDTFAFDSAKKTLTISSAETYAPVSFAFQVNLRFFNYENSKWYVGTGTAYVKDGAVTPLKVAWDRAQGFPEGASINYTTGEVGEPVCVTWYSRRVPFQQPVVPTEYGQEPRLHGIVESGQ
jgi:hypothetical protein